MIRTLAVAQNVYQITWNTSTGPLAAADVIQSLSRSAGDRPCRACCSHAWIARTFSSMAEATWLGEMPFECLVAIVLGTQQPRLMLELHFAQQAVAVPSDRRHR